MDMLRGTSKVSTLVISSGSGGQFTGALDLNDNRFILEATDATDKTSKLAFLRSAVMTGDNSGNWTGPGITSSTLAAYAASGNTSMTLAVADNAFLHNSTFGGQPVDDNSLLVTIALNGDTNLDGSVNFNDLVALEQYYNFPQDQRGWAQGNTTGNGNFADLVALEQNYGASLPGGLALPCRLECFGIHVPGPRTRLPGDRSPRRPLAPPPQNLSAFTQKPLSTSHSSPGSMSTPRPARFLNAVIRRPGRRGSAGHI